MNNYLKRKSMALAFLTIILFTLLMGCTMQGEEIKGNQDQEKSQGQYPLEVVDGTGNKVVIHSQPERIISLAPSHTEILYGLELGDKIVGVTQYCDYPKEALEKPQVGDSFTLNLEKVLELEPDLVIQYWGMNEDLKAQLEAAGITLLTFAPESLGQIEDTIKQIGLATDREEKASELINGIEQKKRDIIQKISKVVKNDDKVKVFYEIEYSSALWTVGKGAFIDELIQLSGGENIASDAQGSYAQYSIEALVEKDPDVYITNTFNLTDVDIKGIQARPAFREISAIKNNRIHILDGNLLSRPSQRVVEALEEMAKAIHPEAFQ